MGNGEYLPLSLERNHYMSFISWFIILFAGFLYLALRVSEIRKKQKQDQTLQLNLPTITADIEKRPVDEEESYIQQVFLTQFSKYLAVSTTYESWSDKGKSLYITPQFGKLLRYNNQYYLNLGIQFSYTS